jgi:hypothetical protein
MIVIIQENNRRYEMGNLVQVWLNPINLGILFLCTAASVWILAQCAPKYKDK